MAPTQIICTNEACGRQIFPDDIGFEQDALLLHTIALDASTNTWVLTEPTISPLDECGFYCRLCSNKLRYSRLDSDTAAFLDGLLDSL